MTEPHPAYGWAGQSGALVMFRNIRAPKCQDITLTLDHNHGICLDQKAGQGVSDEVRGLGLNFNLEVGQRFFSCGQYWDVSWVRSCSRSLPFNSHSLCPNGMLTLVTNSSNIELAAAKRFS